MSEAGRPLTGGKMKRRRIPLRSFFRNPAGRFFLLSPDGTMISSLRPWNGRLNIFVQTGPRGDAIQATRDTERDIQDYFWKSNRYLIYLKDTDGDFNFHLYRVELKSRQVTDLTPLGNVRVGIVDALEHVSENEILIESNQRDRNIFDLYRLNVSTGKIEMLMQNTGATLRWVADRTGSIRATVNIEGVDFKLLTRPHNTSDRKSTRLNSSH